MISLSPYADFETASNEVLAYLHQRLGFDLWMVTRTESDDWIVLTAQDHGYDVASGDVFRWTDSFCSRMVRGLGPRVAPVSSEVREYATAPIAKQVPIGAYVGVPLTRHGGKLFGTLCAIDPQPVADEIQNELPLVEMMARLLTTILENELKAEEEHRRAERATAESLTDKLTGLYNRRGWEDLLAIEDKRCRRYGHPACVVSIDLDELKVLNDTQGHAQGDALLCRAANAMKTVTRESDVAARVGGDEFAILAVECDLGGADLLIKRLEQLLAEQGVLASIGSSMRKASGSLAEAHQSADRRMYECKRRRKSDRGQPVTN